MLTPDSAAYVLGDTVLVTAVADTGWSFMGWSGGLGGAENPDTVVVDSSMTIVATFEPIPTGVEETNAPRFVTLLPNYPNPFSRDTSIRYGLPAAGNPVLEVFDVRGRRLFRARLPGRSAGWHTIRFDPVDAMGQSMPSGVYFYRLTTGGLSVTRRMVLLK
jgi:hypothetical protein